MCLISLAWGASADFPLVIAANRDEFYNRPTAPLSAWTSVSGHTMVGGRDLRDGGTWMGFTPSGRFACLTNVRAPLDEMPAHLRSRGELPVAWLSSHQNAQTWASTVNMQDYAGFNLLVGDWHARTCMYISNREEKTAESKVNSAQAATEDIADKAVSPSAMVRNIGWQSIVGLSNAALDTPWPKTQCLKAAMTSSLQAQPGIAQLQQQLQAALQDTQPVALQDLPHTGLTPDREQALSSVFVRYPALAPQYGTRTSLVAVLNASGALHLQETTHTGEQPGRVASYILDW